METAMVQDLKTGSLFANLAQLAGAVEYNDCTSAER